MNYAELFSEAKAVFDRVAKNSPFRAQFEARKVIARKWTIQDAKDGDVLATLDYILIFKEFLKNDGGISYCHYDFGAGNPQFVWLEDKNWYFGKEAIIHPATKEQRDLLFQKMKEAGYEWDAEKKELKKIEQPSTDWSEEDEKIRKWLVDELYKSVNSSTNKGFDVTMGGKALAWLEKQGNLMGALQEANKKIGELVEENYYLKEEQKGKLVLTPEAYERILKLGEKQGEQKPTEWSKEDEKMLDNIIKDVMILHNSKTIDGLKCKVNWLKSLKERVQPQPKQEWSEEEEEMLNLIIARLHSHPNVDLEEYSKEYDWLNYGLKSLRHQNRWKPSDEHYELEEFVKIVRGNLTGISKAVQKLFEAKYLQLTGNKMYGGFKD